MFKYSDSYPSVKRFRIARSTICLAILLALLLSLTLSACSKKQESQSATSFSSTDLFNLLPESTLAFWVIDLQSQAYNAYRQQPHADAFGLSEWMPASQTEFGRLMATFLRALMASGLISDDPAAKQSLKQAVAFVSWDDSTNKLAIGMGLSPIQGVNMREKLSAFQSTFRAADMNLVEKNLNESSAFQVTLSNSFSPAFSNEIYFAASNERLFVTTSNELAQSLLAKNFAAGFQKLQKLPSFTRIDEALPKSNQVSFGFLDFTQLFSALQRISPSAELKSVSQSFPAEALGYAFSVAETPRSSLVFYTPAKNDDQKRWLGNITSDRLGEPLKFALPKSDLALYLDGGFLANLKKAAYSELSTDSQEAAKKALQFTEGASSITFSAELPSGASPLPSLSITFKPTNFDQGLNQIQNALTNFVKELSGSSLVWKERNLRGMRALSTQSVLAGFGVTVGTFKERIIFSTSEEGFLAQIESLSTAQGILKMLPSTLVNFLMGKRPLVAAYLKSNFDLARFMPFINLSQLKMGAVSNHSRLMTLNVSPGLLFLDFFELPAPVSE